MAAVGGCMVLFYVLMALLEEAGIVRLISLPLSLLGIEPDIVRALLHGVFEFSGGCAAIATLHIPLRLAVAFTAFTVSFGGLCVSCNRACSSQRRQQSPICCKSSCTAFWPQR